MRSNDFLRPILLTLALVVTSVALAEDLPASIQTSAGVVEIKRAAGPPCGADSYDFQCLVLTVDHKKITSEPTLKFTAALPHSEHPTIIGVYGFSGGASCCEHKFFLDVSRRPVRVQEGFGLGPDDRMVGGQLVFKSGEKTDEIGDAVTSTYRYRPGVDAKPRLVGTTAGAEYIPRTRELYASDYVSSPRLRKPLLRLVAKGQFASFRRYFDVSSPTTVIDKQYIIGTGNIQHAGNMDGFFVIDTKNNLAWALNVDLGYGEHQTTGRKWGVLTPEDVVPQREIDAWLAKIGATRLNVKDVPLSDDLVSLYLQPRLKQEPADDAPPKVAAATPHVAAAPAILHTSGGTFTVPVTINGALTLDFVLDSGAADVSIPADVVMTLVRTGTIKQTDFLGQQEYRLADGSVVPSKIFRIQTLTVGNKTVENVRGSVASINGSLLLGQSFLNRFKSWSIDNEKHALVLN